MACVSIADQRTMYVVVRIPVLLSACVVHVHLGINSSNSSKRMAPISESIRAKYRIP